LLRKAILHIVKVQSSVVLTLYQQNHLID